MGGSSPASINKAVVFLLNGDPGSLALTDIDDIRFTCATQRGAGQQRGGCGVGCGGPAKIPEPGSLALVGPALLGKGAVRRRAA